ncbi:hypothetical protein AES38_05995 [Clavibacter capsici]|uniref:PKD domain-containing protein n=1 Tax=Clavibacter capsici TaxID=1874630 RepID=A0AAE7CCK0_9MICO|nr:hypothetical protein AES38_05995 [Clavibacter capsici]QIS44670.1 hypothetical protein GW570_06010 [Clavibacter capsici]
MRVRAPLGLAVSFALVVLVAPAVHADDGRCARRGLGSSSCVGAEIGAGGVIVQGSSSSPPSGSPNQDAAPVVPRDARESPPVVADPVPRGRSAADVDVSCSPGERLSSGGMCRDGQHAFLPPATWPGKPADPAPAAPTVPGVTLADVARFVPRSASIRSQPNGWALVGAPVNLLTDASAQVVDGTLLGRPAQVRFVPVSFTWNYGDGTISTTDGPGASWKQLGQQDFTTTDTSHVYPSMGDRQVTLTIAYAPSYRFDGGGWQQIPGTLPVQVGPVTIHVLQGSTVLVGGACGTRNAGPGC